MPSLPIGTPDPLGSDPWVSGDSLAADSRLADANMPADVTFDMCAEAATEFLYKRSGRRFRLHNVVVRPNNQGSCGCGGVWMSSTSGYWGTWGNDDGWLAEIELPGPVVASSIVVTVNGVVLASSAYRLYDGHLLVRTDGHRWPMCAHLSSPANLDWSIGFTYGESPDLDGLFACRELAIHYALRAANKISKLPARATSLTRGSRTHGGLTIELARGKKTGIDVVDDWLSNVNPEGLMARPSVMSPDTIRLSSS